MMNKYARLYNDLEIMELRRNNPMYPEFWHLDGKDVAVYVGGRSGAPDISGTSEKLYVLVKHLPTGIYASSCAHKSQVKCKTEALEMLAILVREHGRKNYNVRKVLNEI